MKKTIYCIIAFLLLFFLVGCSQKSAPETELSLGEIADAVERSQQRLPELLQLTAEDVEFSAWLSDYYCVPAAQVEGGVIRYADGVEASEIAVLFLADEKDSKTVAEALSEYQENRRGVFEGYAPQQAAMVKAGMVVANGRYAALLICPDPQAAREAFLDCFAGDANVSAAGAEDSGAANASAAGSEDSGNGAAGVAGDVDSYNEAAILQAWRSGDDSSLSGRNRSILEAASRVIDSRINDGMSDYEKELAIHDFITGWSQFDYSVFGRSAEDGFSDGSDTPYGVLIDQSAMCHGYSSTFQLFMDMLDIECMTVFGIPSGNGVEHSWNIVKLDGEWYCVDCAWDDPIGGMPGHSYFNVTSDYLRKGSIHRWEESSVPEATGTAYAYGKKL